MDNIKNLRITDPNQLLKEFNIEGVPDIAVLIKRCGLTLQSYKPYLSTDTEIRKIGDVQGYIKIDNSNQNIVVNDDLLLIIRKFVAAYLLSYYQLYINGESEYSYNLYQESIYDKKAYHYTLGLLMPDNIFNQETVKSYKDIESLAKKYKVSEFLIREKLEKQQKRKNLTLI